MKRKLKISTDMGRTLTINNKIYNYLMKHKGPALLDLSKSNQFFKLQFDKFSNERGKWIKKSNYFHSEDLIYYKTLTNVKSKVLEIGCGNGQLIGSLNIDSAVGIDISDKSIEKAKINYPHCEFYCVSLENIKNIIHKLPSFDLIIVSDTVGYFEDI